MRKIKNISLALTITPLLFIGCMQEKVSRIIPSKSTDNHSQTLISTNSSIKAKDSSTQIISESELDRLVMLVQNRLSKEVLQKKKLLKPIVTELALAEEFDSDIDNNELEDLMYLVSNSLDDELTGIEGVYSTPIILSEEDTINTTAIENTIENTIEDGIDNTIKDTINDEIKQEDEIISTAIAFLDIPYIWAANGPTSFDCSGFTKYVFKEHGLTIPRYSGNQAKVGTKVNYKELKRGDLVFFNTEKKYKKKVNHVGIYIGNNKFIHASSAKKKVVITSFKKKHFYKKRFLWGQRILKNHSTYASL